MIDGFKLRQESAKHLNRSAAFRKCGQVDRAQAEYHLAGHLVKAAAIMEALAT